MALIPAQQQNTRPGMGMGVRSPMMGKPVAPVIPKAPMGGGMQVKPPMHYDGGGAMPLSMAEPWFARRSDPIGGFNPTTFFRGDTGGRTDNINTIVPAGAYIMPADVVSGMGEGNSHAGAAVIDKMFHSNPHGIQGSHVSGGRGVGIPAPPKPFNENTQFAKGGALKQHVPVVLAHG